MQSLDGNGEKMPNQISTWKNGYSNFFVHSSVWRWCKIHDNSTINRFYTYSAIRTKNFLFAVLSLYIYIYIYIYREREREREHMMWAWKKV